MHTSDERERGRGRGRGRGEGEEEGEGERETEEEEERKILLILLLVHLPLKDVYVANTYDPAKKMEHGFFSSPLQYFTLRVWDRHFPEG